MQTVDPGRESQSSARACATDDEPKLAAIVQKDDSQSGHDLSSSEPQDRLSVDDPTLGMQAW